MLVFVLKIFFFQLCQQVIESHPIDMTIRGTGPCRIEQVFAVGRHVFTPAVGIAIVYQRPETDGRRPGRVRPAKGDPEFTFKVLFLLRADDHIGLVSGDKKIAVEAGRIYRAAETFDDGIAGRYSKGTEVIGAKVSPVALAAIAADIERSAVGGHEIV